MFAVIYIPDFYLQAALRFEPDAASRPVALIDSSQPKPIVEQLNLTARTAGVAPGMTPTQALARSPDILIKARSAAQETAASSALLECAYGFSPNIEATAPGVCTLDLRGFKDLRFANLGQKIVARLQGLNLAAQVGVAANPLLALHAAHRAQPFLLVEHSQEFLAALPIESIGPSPEVLAILRKWGLQTLGQFLALGKEALAERLGPEAIELFDCAVADHSRPLRRVLPPESFAEATDFEHEIETAQPLLFVLRRFLEQLALRLEMAGFVAEELRLELKFSRGPDYARAFRIPDPTRDLATLFRVLDTHLETLRTPDPISGVRLSVKPCRAATPQLGLFETAMRDPNQFFQTLARLTALVGSDRVGTPRPEESHRPDAFAMASVDFSGPLVPSAGADERHEETKVGLCLRRFRPPLQAEVEWRDDHPARLHTRLMKGPVRHALGPWTTSGRWWDSGSWDREEWDVEMQGGELCRLFKQGAQWFLEGIYD